MGDTQRLRVAVLSELPTPYRRPLFARLAARPDLDLRVLYYTRTESDRDWDIARVEGDLPHEEFLPGRAWHLRRRRSLYFHWNPGIGRRLREGRFDVVVLPGWSMPSTLAAVWTCRTRGIPYVLFSETNELSPRPLWLRSVKRVVLRPVVGGASAWLATGSLSAAYLVRHGARTERVRRFANTPDVDALAAAVDAARPRRAAVRAALGIPADVPLAVFVGRLIGAKGVETLVAAQRLLEERGSRVHTLVVGDGVLSESLRARAANPSIRQIVFAGPRRPDELPDVWAASDLFVLPSWHEPWGVVVNEAMAAGLPVVLSDRVGAAADLLVPGRTGHAFAAGDARALADALSAVADDADARRRMGAEARAHVAGWGYGPSVEGFVAAVRLAAGGPA